MARRKGGKNDAEELAVSFIILFLMLPLIGVYLLGKQEKGKKIAGGVLLAIGLVVWIAMGAA